MKGRGESLSLLEKGRRLYQKSRYRTAIPIFKKILLKEPENPDALFHLAYSLNEIDRYKESLLFWHRLGKIDPNGTYVQLNTGCVLQNMGREDLAIRHFKKELKTNPICGQALYNLGVLYFRRHNYKTALPYLEKCYFQKHSRDQIVSKLAHAYFKNAKIEEEIGLYHEHLRAYPQDTWCLNNLGASLMHIGDYARALFFLEKGNRINPDDPMIIRNIRKAQSIRTQERIKYERTHRPTPRRSS